MSTELLFSAPLPAAIGNRALLQQGAALLAQLDPETYATARPGHSSVGAQFRHILDHYRCFLVGLPEARVDYDARRRDPDVERDPAVAARTALRYAAAMEALDLSSGDAPLAVQSDSGALHGVPDWRPSTVGRELQFLASHTTHHYALIKLLLEAWGVETDAELGMAPSTSAYLAGAR
ncbi:MAG TPA: DinB family protein [Gemmatimonadales bacterium]|nr:DinB family protein [Gemmatimonadales bacterium]